ncbi:conserved protein of unknown function [Tepidanaerobacter acetatoxydans Re1]|uniref:Uncharacterized protein n=1 Tax=Tepidanaerobacter acetatoxydans (strain DSM 21804 / JCM 16047 / Re1) TaxID=1209989 RepID=F4LS19_TEPAE|nr:hypothetical protein TepRe1_2236 [Tepidanaerobacter acetatoxydans Re1]CCP27247.1 conserved protein of unknown function [Tepidanaerobacter acetatoxydans Re1]
MKLACWFNSTVIRKYVDRILFFEKLQQIVDFTKQLGYNNHSNIQKAITLHKILNNLAKTYSKTVFGFYCLRRGFMF